MCFSRFHEAGVSTEKVNYHDPAIYKTCPDDAKKQLDALIFSLRRVEEAMLHDSGLELAVVGGFIDGILQGVEGISTGTTKGSDKSAFDILDSGLKGFGDGMGEGALKTASSFGKIKST